MNKFLKLLTVPVIAISTLGIVSCGNNQTSTPVPTTDAGSGNVDGTADIGEADLVIYFYRADANYSDVGAWFWGDGDGMGLLFDSTKTTKLSHTGDWVWLYVPIEFDKEYQVYSDWGFTTEKTITMTGDLWANIIIRDKTGNKDFDGDRSIDVTKKDADEVIRVYSVSQTETFYYDINDVPTA